MYINFSLGIYFFIFSFCVYYNLKARENPEPIFDVSECALKHVPSGIYSLCKVFRKEALLMYDNKLSSLSGGGALSNLSLLTVLDIHGNEFTTLPPDIMCLSSLKVNFFPMYLLQ